MNEVAVLDHQASSLTASVDQVLDIAVSATTPVEIWNGQQRLIDWCITKVDTERRDYEELTAATAMAKAKKWKHTTLQNHACKARHRVVYYEKMLAAFQSGFVMVPNFAMSVFAIRTDHQYPQRVISINRNATEADQQESPIPVGAGKYQNPSPTSKYYDRVETKPGVVEVRWASSDWDNLDFPMDMAKVEVMHAVDHAMKLKIFDELGILPFRRTKGDPVIGGLIRMGGVSRWSAKTAQFLLAWHVDTRTL